MSALALHDAAPGPAALADLRHKVHATAAKRPGIYEFLDATGGVIYVGKAKDVRTRLLSSGVDVREPIWGPFGR